MNDEVKKYLKKAEHSLKVAKDLSVLAYYSDAASKIYYSMFYASQALLKSENIHVIKHSAVESALGYYFVKQGKIDSKFHKMLINARRVRETADYDIDTDTDEENIEPVLTLRVEDGQTFFQEIQRIISSAETKSD